MIKIALFSIALWLVAGVSLFAYMTWMPEPTPKQVEGAGADNLVLLRERLSEHVSELSKYKVGRNFIEKDNITLARNYIADQFKGFGLEPYFDDFVLYGDEYSNIIIDIPAKDGSTPILIVGAHYDSVEGSPGANDNASGVAALIEIGRYFSEGNKGKYGLRLIAFANEEPPYFQTKEMGSFIYSENMPDSENVLGMISLETLGYYTNDEGSQRYPKLINHFYPEKGNFIAFIGNFGSRSLLESSISLFRQNSDVPSEGIASPAFVPGVGWSDHWSFWVTGHKAIMVTDTAPYRYEHYHESTDTPDKLNYEQYTKVVSGLIMVLEGLLEDGVK